MQTIEKITSTIDHVYFNVTMTNNDPINIIPAVYNSPTTTALLENPSEYYCSIVRFTVPIQQVPIFTFRDNTYSVTISNGATDFQQTLIYVPNYTPNLTPGPPDNRQVYSYQQFLDSINNGLRSSFIASGLPGIAPYMTFDPATELFSLNAPATFHNASFSDQNQPIKIWFNTPLWTFFGNFPKIFNGFSPASFNTNGKNFNLIIKPTGNNDITIPVSMGGPTPGYAMSQEFNSLSDWNTLQSIVFFTSTIPIRYESIPATIANNTTTNNNTTISSRQPILTDFELSDDGPLRNYAHYFAPGEYRLVDMTGTNPLRNIDIQVYSQDKNGNLTPIYIQPFDSLTVKILFRRKHIKGSLTY